MNLEPFCFWAVRAVLNISAYFAKAFYFFWFSLKFSWAKQIHMFKIDLSVYCKVRTKNEKTVHISARFGVKIG